MLALKPCPVRSHAISGKGVTTGSVLTCTSLTHWAKQPLRTCTACSMSTGKGSVTKDAPAAATESIPSAPSADAMQPAAPTTSRWAKLQQNLNLAGVSLFLQILGGNQRLAIPHITIPDISTVNWEALKAAGFKAVVFDKDNTLTKPFEMKVEAKLEDSLVRCKQAFGSDGIALYSNSAGLKQYDPEGHEAASLEAALGVKVMRHEQKKPAGDAAEVAQHFGCAAHELVMVGDRYLTDVVFGNRHGMLTIRPAPMTTEGEPAGVLAARRVEEYFVGRWTGQGMQAPTHALVPSGSDAATVFVMGPGA